MKETIRTQERLPVARSQGGNPPDAMVPKTVLVKSLNPVRNLRGEGVVVLNNESNLFNLCVHVCQCFDSKLLINESQDILTYIVPCSDLGKMLRFMAFKLLLKPRLRMCEMAF